MHFHAVFLSALTGL